MGQRGKVTDLSDQATCEVCGLTARTKDELKVHIHHAHETADSNKGSSEQKIDPSPWDITCYLLLYGSLNLDHLFMCIINQYIELIADMSPFSF